MDIVIDHGVRSLVERNAPPGHASRIRARLAGRSRWGQPALLARLNLSAEARSAKAEGRADMAEALVARPKGRAYMAAALLVAAVGAGVWALWESHDDVLETRMVRQAPPQTPLVAPPALNLGPVDPKTVAKLAPLPPLTSLSPEADEARAAREAAASRARLMAYLEALRQLPPEVLLREPLPAGEPLPEPDPIVIPEIVITPLHARMEAEDAALPGDSAPRGEE